MSKLNETIAAIKAEYEKLLAEKDEPEADGAEDFVESELLKCSNPRCIVAVEQELKHRFKCTDKENGVYRCIYCDAKAK